MLRTPASRTSTMTDRSAFSDADAAEAWNEGAQAFDAFIESGADHYRHEVHGPALLTASEPLQGRHVLDLGCGQGFFSRHLARRQARVTAIDLSSELLTLARAHEAKDPLGIDYRSLSVGDIADHLAADAFDLVTACMSMQDVSDVRGALRGAWIVLRPGGRLVFSVPHPATDTPFREWDRDAGGAKLSLKCDRYFDTGPTVCRWNMARLSYPWSTPYWRYTLGEWATLIAEAGFTIDILQEPRPTAAQVAANPDLDDSRRMPYFLIFGVRKPSPGPDRR